MRSAEDGSSALLEIRQEVPDITLSDLKHAAYVRFRIRRRFSAIRVIAMSGAFSFDDIPPGLAADAFYEKGSKLSPLLQIVHAMTSEERSPPLHHRAPAAHSELRRTDMTLPQSVRPLDMRMQLRAKNTGP